MIHKNYGLRIAPADPFNSHASHAFRSTVLSMACSHCHGPFIFVCRVYLTGAFSFITPWSSISARILRHSCIVFFFERKTEKRFNENFHIIRCMAFPLEFGLHRDEVISKYIWPLIPQCEHNESGENDLILLIVLAISFDEQSCSPFSKNRKIQEKISIFERKNMFITICVPFFHYLQFSSIIVSKIWNKTVYFDFVRTFVNSI